MRPGLSISHEYSVIWEYLDEKESEFLFDEIFVRKSYNCDSISLIDGAVIIDVGANIGLFSLHCVSQLKDLTLVSIEPIPSITTVLRRNLMCLQKKAKVHILECAACGPDDDVSDVDFHYLVNCPGESTRNIEEHKELQAYLRSAASSSTIEEIRNHSLSLESSDSFNETETTTQIFRCRIRTLESIIDELGLEKVDLLKVDVEGDELLVLQGVGSAWPVVKQVVAEVHDIDDRLQKVLDLLQDEGFVTKTAQQATHIADDGYVSFIPLELKMFYVYAWRPPISKNNTTLGEHSSSASDVDVISPDASCSTGNYQEELPKNKRKRSTDIIETDL